MYLSLTYLLVVKIIRFSKRMKFNYVFSENTVGRKHIHTQAKSGFVFADEWKDFFKPLLFQ